MPGVTETRAGQRLPLGGERRPRALLKPSQPWKGKERGGDAAVTRLPVSSWFEAGSVFTIKCEALH